MYPSVPATLESTPDVDVTNPSDIPANVIVPSASKLDDPMSMFPNPDVIDPLFNAPVEVSDDVTTADPKVVLLSTLVPFI